MNQSVVDDDLDQSVVVDDGVVDQRVVVVDDGVDQSVVVDQGVVVDYYLMDHEDLNVKEFPHCSILSERLLGGRVRLSPFSQCQEATEAREAVKY